MVINRSYSGELSAEVEKYTRLGQIQASNHLPPSDAARPDVNEIELKGKAETWLASQHRLYDSALVDVAKSITELEQKTVGLHVLVDQLQSEPPLHTVMQTEMAADRITLARAVEQRLRAEAELRYFRASNGIHERAVYPESVVRHLALVVMLWIVESVMNAFFYENAQGLLGGFVVALGVGLINMLMAVALGYWFRLKNLAALHEKFLGWASLVVYILSSIYLNALFAAFRSAYQLLSDPTDPTQFRNAFSSATQAAFRVYRLQMPVGDLMSFLLFGIGFALSLVAFWKGYTSDDRYPGHGAKERRLKTAQTEEHELINQLRARLQEVGQRRVSTTQNALREPGALISVASKRIADLQEAKLNINSGCAAVSRDFRLVLDAYRHSNIAVRATPPPAYFNQPLELSIAPDPVRADLCIEQLRRCQDEARAVQTANQVALNAQLESLQRQTSETLNTALPEFIREVEREAQDAINRQLHTLERVPEVK
jgi:hypothetical protein